MKTRKVVSACKCGAYDDEHLHSFKTGECFPKKEPQHTPTDTAMENLAILDGMKRDGWSESVIDRVERAVNSQEELVRTGKKVIEEIRKCNSLIPAVDAFYDAVAKAERGI